MSVNVPGVHGGSEVELMVFVVVGEVHVHRVKTRSPSFPTASVQNGLRRSGNAHDHKASASKLGCQCQVSVI